jgi:hypothetical protein
LYRHAIEHEHALDPTAAVAQPADLDAAVEVSLAVFLAELGLSGIFGLAVFFELFIELIVVELVVVQLGGWQLLARITADRRHARLAAADAGLATEHGHAQLARHAGRAGHDGRNQ